MGSPRQPPSEAVTLRSESARVSVAHLKAAQEESGAFVASPDFDEYQFCWLRDASFVSHALDRGGAHDAAARYHSWVLDTLGVEHGLGALIGRAVARHREGKPVDPAQMPPARFNLDGTIAFDDWPNFQIDGYGCWLWAYATHLDLAGKAVPARGLATVATVAAYLDTFATQPCFDVWEEHGDEVHCSTLAAVFAGLSAAGHLLDDIHLHVRSEQIRSRLRGALGAAGHLAKSSSDDGIDASALWCSFPFGVFTHTDPVMAATAREVERQLSFGGGIRRYRDDTYFGGGAWPVLTASLGVHYAASGNLARARSLRDGIAELFDGDGRLAEQHGGDRRDPTHYAEWVQRWGPPAADLLWSHAMYVILCAEIDARTHHGHECS